jgi:hypothetical protein
MDHAATGGEMNKVCLAIAILVASGWLSEPVAAKSVPINNGGVLQRRCGAPPYEGCVWCGLAACYFVHHCSATRCTYTTEPLGTKGGPNGPTKGGEPIGAAPIVTGKPIQASPPKGSAPPNGTHPVNAAPIVKGQPVQASPGSGGGTQTILERGSGDRH